MFESHGKSENLHLLIKINEHKVDVLIDIVHDLKYHNKGNGIEGWKHAKLYQKNSPCKCFKKIV